MSVFLFVYAGSNMVLGTLGDRVGARRMMGGALVVWGVAAAVMGFAASYPAMLAGRALRGIGEGPTFPMMARYVRNWFLPTERGRANSIWLLGHDVGPALALPLALVLMSSFGWRSVLFFQALVAIGIVLPMLVFFTADRPSDSPWVGTAEVIYVERTQLAENGAPLGWIPSVRLIVGHVDYWLIVAFHTCQLALFAGLTTWLPKYLADERGFDVQAAAFWGSLPYVVGAAAMIGFAFISDRVQRRAPFCVFSKLATAALVLAATYSPWNEASAVLFALVMGAWSLSPPLYYAILQRIAPPGAMGAASGLDNGLANVGAAFAPALIGYLIAVTGNYLAGLLILAASSVAAALFMVVLWLRGY